MNKMLLSVGLVLMIGVFAIAGGVYLMDVDVTKGQTIQIMSGGKSYPAYLATPDAEGDKEPTIVLLHSFNGLEPGYKTLIDKLAAEHFVVIAPEWQTFTKTPRDEVVMQLLSDTVDYLKNRTDVDPNNIGLTGFCAGGRFTMLFLPQMKEFKSGVAFYGFPYSGGPNNQSTPVEFISQLTVPMFIIHGIRDQASNVTDIYKYVQALDAADKYFEMKIYQGQPHGFMIVNGALSDSMAAKEAYEDMAEFFLNTLK